MAGLTSPVKAPSFSGYRFWRPERDRAASQDLGHLRQVRKRRAEGHLNPAFAAEAAQYTGRQLLGGRGGGEHLPVAGDEFLTHNFFRSCVFGLRNSRQWNSRQCREIFPYLIILARAVGARFFRGNATVNPVPIYRHAVHRATAHHLQAREAALTLFSTRIPAAFQSSRPSLRNERLQTVPTKNEVFHRGELIARPLFVAERTRNEVC